MLAFRGLLPTFSNFSFKLIELSTCDLRTPCQDPNRIRAFKPNLFDLQRGVGPGSVDRSRLERGPAPAPLTLNAAVSTLCDVTPAPSS